LKSLALDLINTYDKQIQIYTDGSKTADGKTAAAYYIPNHNVQFKARLTDNITIFAAELMAIQLALLWVINTLKDNDCEIILLTDSMSCLEALSSEESKSRPSLLIDTIDIYNQISSKITFAWIPSHIGIPGNEVADQLAVRATTHCTVDIVTPMELSEHYKSVHTYIHKQWQMRWANCPTGNVYKLLFPNVSNKPNYVCPNRRKEVTVTRFRLGKCRLNAYLYKIGLHPNGNCDTCFVPETIEHFLLKCHQNSTCAALLAACKKRNIIPIYPNILLDSELLEVICNNLHRHI
jgi:ribonuclease HI